MFTGHGHLVAALPVYGQHTTAKFCPALLDSMTWGGCELASHLH